jgi:hypothetical protein
MEWKIYAENEPADYASDFFPRNPKENDVP